MNTFGATQIPIQLPAVGEEITDPAISLIANYLAARLNKYAQTAWSAVAPPIKGLVSTPSPLASPVVRQVFGNNPEDEVFNEATLPSLYLWRGPRGQKPYWLAEDWYVSPDTWTLLWLFRPANQTGRQVRQSFINGIAKLVDIAIEEQQDPVYVAPVDLVPSASGADPTAATTPPAPTTIKLAIASSTVAQSYSGAALDGAIGVAAFVPAQLPSVTITGSAGSGTVVFTGLGEDGAARTSRVDITGSGLGTFYGDWSLSQITQIDVPIQPNALGTQTFGLAGFVGLGSNVFVLGSFVTIEVSGWTEKVITIRMGNADPRSYEGIEITFDVEERWIRDIAANGAADTSDTAQFTDSPDNAYIRETALYS